MAQSEAYQRGHSHGWDAANYANAYGGSETTTAEGQRRAAETYSGQDQQQEREDYLEGFLEGWEAYETDDGADADLGSL